MDSFNEKAKETMKKIGIAGIVSAAITAYVLYKDTDAQNEAKTWIHDLRDEIADEVGKLNTISHEVYADIVSRTLERAEKVKGVAKEEVTSTETDLLQAWEKIEEGLADILNRSDSK